MKSFVSHQTGMFLGGLVLLFGGCAEPSDWTNLRGTDCCAEQACCEPPQELVEPSTVNDVPLMVQNEAGSGVRSN